MASAGDLGRRIAKGAAWSILLRMSMRSLGLINTLVLVRILSPADFGLVALATLLIGILEFIFDFSFNQVLIREQNADRRLYDTVWTLSIIRSLIMGAVIACGAKLAASFYGDERLVPIFLFLAVSSTVVGFENVGTVDFVKKLQFHRTFYYRFLSRVVTFAVTLGLALSLRTYWALVWGSLAGQVAMVVLSFVLCDYRPRFDLSQTRRILGFTIWYMVASGAGALLNRSPGIILGRLHGTESVGYFEVAREVADLPTSELVWPITRALFPGYAAASGDIPTMRMLFTTSMAITMCLAIPLTLGIAATAELVVRIAFGVKWLATIPVIEILAFVGLARLSFSGSDSLVITLGKPRLIVYLGIAYCCMTVPATWFGAWSHGLTGTASGYLIGVVLCTLLSNGTAAHLLGMSPISFWKASARSFVAGAIMYAVVSTVVSRMIPSVDALAGYVGLALLSVALGAAVYVMILVGLWKLAGLPSGAERIMLDEIRKRILAWRKRRSA